MSRPDLFAAGLGGLATVLVGSSVAAAGLLTTYPALSGQAARYAVSFLLLVAWARTRGVRPPRPSAADLAWLAGVALTGLAGFNVLLIRATAAADPSVVGAVVGTVPVVLALVGAWSVGRRPAGRVVLGAVIVVVGAGLVERAGGSATPLGLAMAIGALAGEVCFSVLAVPPLRRIGPLAVSIHATWMATVMLAVWAVAVGEPVRAPTAVELAALVHMATLVTAVAFVCWYTAVDRLGADRAGLLAGLIPVSALLTSVLAGVDQLTAAKVVGVTIVAFGIVVGTRPDRPRTVPGELRTPGTP